LSLPSREQCLKLLEKHGLPENIVRHSLAVEKVAVFLAKKLLEAGEKIDVELVGRSALLHDVGKAQELKLGSQHVALGEKILLEENLPEIAKIVGKHGLYQVFEEKPFDSWEEKLVFYSDKRINHAQVVSLDERFEYLCNRYGLSTERNQRIIDAKPLAEKLEGEIFAKIGLKPSLEELA